MTLPRPDDLDTEELPIHDRDQGVDGSANLSESAHYQLGSVEFSELLENSISLESPKVRYITVLNPPASVLATDERSPSSSLPESQPIITPAPLASQPDEVVIPLLEERLVIDRQKRKVGEVVVRKEIETRIVEVPIRREKLIVEQVSPEYRQIAVVELGQAQVTEFDSLDSGNTTLYPTVSGEFASVEVAIQFLEAIASESDSGLQKVKVSVVLEDEALQATYQHWLDQYSTEVTP